jgi:CheY-like chemotaxis protein
METVPATEALRALGYRGPIIAVTAHVQPEMVNECIAAGCDTVLVKPIDIDVLGATLAQYLATDAPDLPHAPSPATP